MWLGFTNPLLETSQPRLSFTEGANIRFVYSDISLLVAQKVFCHVSCISLLQHQFCSFRKKIGNTT